MDKIYKIIEVAGTSTKSFDDAISNGIAEAAKTLKGMAWFEVKEMRGGLKDGEISQYQAVIRIGFLLIS